MRVTGMGRRGRALVPAGVVAALALLAGAITPVRAQQPSGDAALLEELAMRLLGPPFPGPAGVEVPPVRLLPGAVPDELPVSVPLPPNSRLIGSVVRPTFFGSPVGPEVGTSVEIVLDVSESPAAVLAFYTEALGAAGLTQPRGAAGPRPGGFLSSVGRGSQTFFCRSERGPFVEVAAFAREGRPTDVRVRVQDFAGPCGAPGPFPGPMPPSDPLPPLEPPAGVTVLVGGSGGSPLSRSSDAVAQTTMSMAELEAHYARQLAAAGWERRAGGADGPLAWSLWRVPSGDEGPPFTLAPGERQGLLTVVEGPGMDRRSLHVEVVSAGSLGIGPVFVGR